MRESMIQLSGFLGRHRRLGLGRLGRRPPHRPADRRAPDRPPDRRRLRRPRQPVEGGQRRASQSDFGRASDGIAVVLKADARREPRRPRRGGRPGPARRSPAVEGLSPAAGRGAPRPSRSCSGPARRCSRCAARQSRRRADRLGHRPCAKTSTPAAPRAASPPTSPASRRSGPGCRSSPRRTWRRPSRAGFPIVALILLVVFGSLAAAALPLALGFVSVIVTGALIYFISLRCRPRSSSPTWPR